MLILPNEINKILAMSSEDVTKTGKKMFEQDKVKISKVNYNSDVKFEIECVVEDTDKNLVNVKKGKDTYNLSALKYSCNCDDYERKMQPCKHIIAALFDMYVYSDKYINFKEETKKEEIKDYSISKLVKREDELLRRLNSTKSLSDFTDYRADYETRQRKLRDGKTLSVLRGYINNVQKMLSLPEKLKIEPILEISEFAYFSSSNANLFITLKIGAKRMYKVKNIYEFAESFLKKELVKYGKELEFIHDKDLFRDEDKKALEFFVGKGNELTNFARTNSSYVREKDRLGLKYLSLDQFFELYENRKVKINNYSNISEIELVTEDPKLGYSVEETENYIDIKGKSNDEYYIQRGQLYDYILYKDKLYRCSEEFSKKVMPILKLAEENKNNSIQIPKEYATEFCEYIVPSLEKSLDITYKSEIIKKYGAEKLAVKVFLDINKDNYIVADLKLVYNDIEFNPFLPLTKEAQKIKRNIKAEDRVIEALEKNKFVLEEDKKLYIFSDEDIYEFMQNGINEFMEKFEVFVTDKFKSKNIIRPKNVNLGVRIKNDLLEIETYDLGFDEEELAQVIKSYRLKRKYYRLKDGSFVDIGFSGIDTLVDITDNLGISSKDIVNKKIKVPKYRAMYLNEVLEENNDIAVVKEKSFKEIVRNMNLAFDMDIKIPDSMENILREYQKNGYNWLKTLDNCGFGGILADDMGLGKTLQVIALLEDVREDKDKNNHKEETSTSIVVCPSSLYINWEKEILKFAPNIKTLVINGTASERQKKLSKALKYDVVITSYDMLKRDIEDYKNINFRYIIADEAQYIKNNNTQNAKALKALKGKTKFALTGTPMENSLAELWSIFDFCMPGYLFSYKKFKDKYESKIVKEEDKDALALLGKIVAPFILRRTKKEVLKELPEKTETVMFNVMEEEQEKVYKAYLKEAKKELEKEIETNGMSKSQIKILSIITRLRQICCHPSLFLENYNGESSKLNQCMELIEDAYNSKHKILVFSQFVSMFDIIKKELEKRNIKYYELTGNTKVDTRVEMVDEFNKDEEMSVFLVSLKAGGTGLNLIGADIVIHFDPWWNLSVQNQATDRAYRIGQRKNVQVFSLITEHSIEEKVKKLQEAKMQLTDNVIKPGETFISNMSKEEVMNLFDN